MRKCNAFKFIYEVSSQNMNLIQMDLVLQNNLEYFKISTYKMFNKINKWIAIMKIMKHNQA